MSRHVFINGRFLEQRVTGVQRFAAEIVMALDALLETEGALDADVTLLSPPGARRLPLKVIRLRSLGPLHGHSWEQVTLPLAVGSAPLVGLGATGPVGKRNQIVTIHDAAVRAVPHAYSAKFRALYGALLPVLVERAHAIMTVSEFSKRELVNYFGAQPERIRVTGEGWEHAVRVAPDNRVLAKHGLQHGRYVLAVSSLTPHKNVAVLARAMGELAKMTAAKGSSSLDVALAGAEDARLFAETGVAALERVRFLGYVQDAELRALYQSAAAFVFPSLYEGFGLPPLEAMAAGCPVICSNAAAIPEVCGDAAIYFDPTDASALARAILLLATDPAERERRVRLGRERLARFSWRAAAQVYLDVLREWTQPPRRALHDGRRPSALRDRRRPSAPRDRGRPSAPRDRGRPSAPRDRGRPSAPHDGASPSAPVFTRAMCLGESHAIDAATQTTGGSALRTARVALVHDWLTGMRGGEYVLEAIAELFVAPELFTLLRVDGSIQGRIAELPCKTTWLQSMPAASRYYRHFLPLMPSMVHSFDLRHFDLVVSSSHCVAKGVKKGPGAVHVSYVHAPMRYMWDRFDDYFGKGRSAPAVRLAARGLRPFLRRWDRAVSSPDRVDVLIANSAFTAEQIRRAYRREPRIVRPFADVSRFTRARKPTGQYLVVGAFAPNKRVDLAIEAFNRLGLPLVVVGKGQDEAILRAMAKPNVVFLGSVANDEVDALYARARAFVFPGIEDFGITPLEAMASGLPVVAYAAGGALETVVDGDSGLLFHEPTPDALVRAIERIESGEVVFDEARVRARGRAFTKERFHREMTAQIQSAWAAAGKPEPELARAMQPFAFARSAAPPAPVELA